METHLLTQKLKQLRLTPMAQAIEEGNFSARMNELSSSALLEELVDMQISVRDENCRKRLRTQAKLIHRSAHINATALHLIEGITKHQLQELAGCQWIKNGYNISFTGAAGTGKSWLACAIANSAINNKYKVEYWHFHRLLEELCLRKEDGSIRTFRKAIQNLDVIIIDDFAICPMSEDVVHEFFEIINNRYNKKSIVFTSQLGVNAWQSYLGHTAGNEAILDRIVHRLMKYELRTENSLRVLDQVEGMKND